MQQIQAANKAAGQGSSSYYPTISHLPSQQQTSQMMAHQMALLQQQQQNGNITSTSTHNSTLFQGAADGGQFSKEAKNSGLDSQIQYVLNNQQHQQQMQMQQPNRASGTNQIPSQSKEHQYLQNENKTPPVSSFSNYMQAKTGGKNPGGPYGPSPYGHIMDSNGMALTSQPAPLPQGTHHKTSFSHQQKQQQIPTAQMSVAQIQIANNQSVNSWFISRLKSILQGSGSTTSNPQVAPPQMVAGKRYDVPPHQRDGYVWEQQQPRWQQEQQHSQIMMQALHNHPNSNSNEGGAGASNNAKPGFGQSSALSASQKQQQIVSQVGGLGLMSSNELTLLNKRQKSREADTNSRMKHINGMTKAGLKESIPKASSVEDGPYNRVNSKVTSMPDVVTKVTQNSMSFTTEQKPRKQSTQSYQAAKSMASATTTVPAINSGAPGIIRNSREGQISSAKAVSNEGQQYSDLGSSYKSGMVSGQDSSAAHQQYKAQSQLGKIQNQPIDNKGWHIQDQSKRVNTYIRQRELSNFLRRDEQLTQKVEAATASKNQQPQQQQESSEYIHMSFGSQVKEAGELNGDVRKTRNLLTNSDQQQQQQQQQRTIGKNDTEKLQSEKDFQRKMTANSINNRGAAAATLQTAAQNQYQNITMKPQQLNQSDGIPVHKQQRLIGQQTMEPTARQQAQIQAIGNNSVRLVRKQSSANPANSQVAQQQQLKQSAASVVYQQDQATASGNNQVLQFIKNGGQTQLTNLNTTSSVMRQGVHMIQKTSGQGVDQVQAHVVQLSHHPPHQHRGSELQKRTTGGVPTHQQAAASASSQLQQHQATGIHKQHSYPTTQKTAQLQQQAQAALPPTGTVISGQHVFNHKQQTQANEQIVGPRGHAQGQLLANDAAKTTTTQGANGGSTLQAGHSGKYLGLGNKSGLGGTHRHSLEKLKEYESQLLLSSSAGNTNSNVALLQHKSGSHQEPAIQSRLESKQPMHIKTQSNASQGDEVVNQHHHGS